MVFELDPTLHTDLISLAWLPGHWEGVGVVGYPGIEEANFGQELHVTHDGRPFLEWNSHAWLLDQATGEKIRPLATESGFWRPGQKDGEFELLLAHPTGYIELYFGDSDADKKPRIQLSTEAVVRSPRSKEYTAATRLYGLVESKLMWAMDMAAMGHPLQSHMSAQLQRVG